MYSYDWNAALKSSNGITLNGLLKSFLTTGFQATNLGLAIEEINRMRAWRLSDIPVAADEDEDFIDPVVRGNVKYELQSLYSIDKIVLTIDIHDVHMYK